MRAFFRKRPALTVTALFVAVAVALDRLAGLHALAMVIALIWMVTIADAWDEETRP